MRRWRRYLNRTVRVHTTAPTSIEGVLVLVTRDFVVLRGAGELLTDDQRAELAGEILVERTRIDYLQVV